MVSGLGQTLGVADADGWNAPVRVMNQSGLLSRPALPKDLFERIQNEVRARRTRHVPADDAPGTAAPGC